MSGDALNNFLNLSSAGTWDKFGRRWEHRKVLVATEQ
tara:strand:+ start:490 stop:600 length:111 start_codon:yes stop_codon:yes gene_type:complete